MDSPLNTSEKKMLLSNAQSDKVPHYLISKITAKMKNENLIQSPVPLIPKSVPGILGLLILTLGLLAVGYAVGKSGTSSQQIQKSETASQDLMASTKGKAQFVLFVHNDDIPPADPMQQVEEYGAWLTQIKADRIAGGEHLHDQGWVLNSSEGKGIEVTTQDKFAGREEIGGYFMFEATDASEAVAIARTCPHLNYKGTLELREIFQH